MNLNRAVDLYEVEPRGPHEGAPPLHERYEQALNHFEQADFRQAAAILGQLLVEFPDDGPTLVLMSRVVEAMLGDPEAFDPVWQLSGK